MTMNAGRPQRRKAAPAGDPSSKFVRNRMAIRSITTDASFWVPRGDPTDNVRTRSSSPSGLLCLQFSLRWCQQMGRKYASISPPLSETMVYPRRRASEELCLPKLITSRICLFLSQSEGRNETRRRRSSVPPHSIFTALRRVVEGPRTIPIDVGHRIESGGQRCSYM